MKQKRLFSTILARAAMTLLAALLTATTAWATDLTDFVTVSQSGTATARFTYSNHFYRVDWSGINTSETTSVQLIYNEESNRLRVQTNGSTNGFFPLYASEDNVDYLTISDISSLTPGQSSDGYTHYEKLATGASTQVKKVCTVTCLAANAPTWNWSDDATTCTATFTCAEDASLTATVDATVTHANVRSTASVTFNSTAYDDTKYEQAHFSQDGDTYTIHTSTGWDIFCELLAENDQGIFSGKTVKLGADITGTSMAGGSDHEFTGTFDGDDHTLTVTLGSASDPINEDNAAPFRKVESGCTIQDLHVAGDIYTSGKFAAGIAGIQNGAVTIRNCHVSTSIHSSTSGEGTHGGLVGQNGSGSTLTIEGCVFDGKLLTCGATATTTCGGFVGWCNGTISVINCLYVPAALADGETEVATGATFALNATDGTITNSFYTRILDTAQGKAPHTHTVTASANVTIGAIALTGDATQYTVCGITAYSGGGLQRGGQLYYGSGDQLSLTLSNTATGAPLGYWYGVYSASAGTINGTTLTMPDEDVIVSVNTETGLSDGQQHEITYMLADGTTQTAQAIALDGTETSLAAGWYFVGLPTVAFDHTILLDGDVTLILADGMTMNVTTTGDTGPTVCNDCINAYGHSLNIYGQNGGTGTLNLLAQGDANVIYISKGTLGIHGGKVNATVGVTSNYRQAIGVDRESNGDALIIDGGVVTASGNNGYGIYVCGGNSKITGGQVTATGVVAGLAISDNVTVEDEIIHGIMTLGCSKPTDFIYLSSIYTYEGEGEVKIAEGQRLLDGTNIYTGGTLTSEQISTISGKTLRSVIVLDETKGVTPLTPLSGQDGIPVMFTRKFSSGIASTICLPFSVSKEQADAAGTFYDFVSVNDERTVVTMKEENVTNDNPLEANKPYLFMPNSDDDVSFSATIATVASSYTAGTTPSTGNVDGWTFCGTYTTIEWSSDPQNIYGFASGQAYGNSGDQTEAGKFIRVHTGGIRPFRAYLMYEPSANGARAMSRSAISELPETMTVRLIGSDGQTTAIGTLDTRTGDVTFGDEWYTLDGRRLPAKPTAKGIYINRGNKVVIK